MEGKKTHVQIRRRGPAALPGEPFMALGNVPLVLLSLRISTACSEGNEML